MLDRIDVAVVRFLNAFANEWPLFDWLVLDIFQLNSVRLLPIVGCLIWLWFTGKGDYGRRRTVFDGFLGAGIALIITRAVQNLSPHRPRPALSGEFDFVLPAGGYTNDWSSFPSDTAGLCFALVTAIWRGDRRLGIAAAVWGVVVVCFPRLYGGFHYPSDLLAGAAVGVGATLLAARPFLDGLFGALERLAEHRRGLFYCLAFAVAFQVTTYFADARQVASKALVGIGVVRTGD